MSAAILANPNDIPAKPDFGVRAAGTLDLTGYVADILPATDEVLLSLGGDLKEYARLLKDDQVASLLQQRKDALIAAEWVVEPGGEDARDIEAADFIRDQFAAVGFDRVTRKMHGGVLYGYSVAECLWEAREGNIHLADMRVRKPWRFGFAPDGALRLKLQSKTEAMPPRKFWICTFGAEDDDTPYGRGLGHVLWWPVFLKRNGARFWAAYLDRYGVPSTRAVYPANATEDDKTKALRAAMELRSEGAVAMPEGFDVTIIEAAKSGAGDFSAFLAYWDDAIAKVILSQTGTSRIGQYSGTAEVHNEVRRDVLKSDADLLCESLNNGPVKWLAEWNFPGAARPKIWRKVENRERVREERERDKALYDMGLELTEEAVHTRYGGEWQRRAGAAPVQGPAFAEPGERGGPAPARGYPEELTDQLEALSMDASTHMLDAVRGMIERAESHGGDLAAFAEHLLSAYPLPGAHALQNAVAGALATAALAGMAHAAEIPDDEKPAAARRSGQ